MIHPGNNCGDLKVLPAGDPEPLDFDLEPDEEAADEETDDGQLRQVFLSLELGPDETDRIYFEDIDGEDVFL